MKPTTENETLSAAIENSKALKAEARKNCKDYNDYSKNLHRANSTYGFRRWLEKSFDETMAEKAGVPYDELEKHKRLQRRLDDLVAAQKLTTEYAWQPVKPEVRAPYAREAAGSSPGTAASNHLEAHGRKQ